MTQQEAVKTEMQRYWRACENAAYARELFMPQLAARWEHRAHIHRLALDRVRYPYVSAS